MSQLVFLPGFDGRAELRAEFLAALALEHQVRAVSYPNRVLGTLDAYRVHAMAQIPVDWAPVLVAESFSGLVAASWAALDPRVRALVLCGAFARNPVGPAAALGAALPALVKLGPMLMGPLAWGSGDARRARWGAALTRALAALDDDVVAERLRLVAGEDAGPALAALRIPVLLVHFASDTVIGRPARAALEAACRGARVLTLEGPHFAIATRPAQCAAAISAAISAALA
jgi:pimeloyl-ACP methyl ester carboxylesterase